VAEIVDDGITGFLRSDTRDLADALAAVDRLDRKACRAAVDARFSMQRMAADHLVFYLDVLSGRRHGVQRELHNVA
jgi:hypothetical protein